MEFIQFSIGDTAIGGVFSGSCKETDGSLKISGSLEFYLRDAFMDPLDLGIEAIDLGETIYENIHRPLDNYLRGRVGASPSGPQRLGIHTGEPYPISDEWSGRFEGTIYRAREKSDYVQRR